MATSTSSAWLRKLVKPAEVLIVVPPFAAVDRPALGPHLLQAIAAQHGVQVRIVYWNLYVAAQLGLRPYATICLAPPVALVGERLFARAAHGLPPLGRHASRMFDMDVAVGATDAAGVERSFPLSEEFGLGFKELLDIESRVPLWVDEFAHGLADLEAPTVGCTSMFEQNNASLALLNRIKQLQATVTTIIGGANCEGEMADGVASLTAAIDHVFRGESDRSFPSFLESLRRGGRPPRIVEGEPLFELDDLPVPNFDEFFEQRASLLDPDDPVLQERWLPYESSRGCWWGQKHHCTFCGLNGEGMEFRHKKAERVVDDLLGLADRHSTRRFFMVDNIMPNGYFNDLIPQLANIEPPLDLFYEQKANLTLQKVIALKKAGVSSIQPGIESLSTSILRRMDKGVNATQNVALLRNARATALDLQWNLLWGFPGEEISAYTETIALVRQMHHLQPPSGLFHVILDRFSPYFTRPEAYGITGVRPFNAYHSVYPGESAARSCAYHFVGDYENETYKHPEVVQELSDELARWRSCWKSPTSSTAVLRVERFANWWVLRDTRGLEGNDEFEILDPDQVEATVSNYPYVSGPITDRALQKGHGVLLDSWYVSLVTAPLELLVQLNPAHRPPQKGELLSIGPPQKGGAY